MSIQSSLISIGSNVLGAAEKATKVDKPDEKQPEVKKPEITQPQVDSRVERAKEMAKRAQEFTEFKKMEKKLSTGFSMSSNGVGLITPMM